MADELPEVPDDRRIESDFRDPKLLVPYDRNSRTHTDAQIDELRASIRQYGFTSPAIIDEHERILAGHARTSAATLEELPEIPVRIVYGLSEAEKRAYVIADNKLALNADWNMALLRSELSALKAEDLDLLGIVGFSDVELGQLFAASDEPFNREGEWTGMPEYQQDDLTAYRTIKVHLKDEAAVADLARLLGQPISERTRYLWHPRVESETLADRRYVATADDVAQP